MSSDEPWMKRWKFVAPLDGGGQGDTSLVASEGDVNLSGVLKCLKKGKESNSKARRRMFQEVSNLKVLHGAGAKVPKVLDDNTANFESTEPLFFVMEEIHGKTLATVVRESPLELETAIAVVLQICDTFRYAVKERIIHRDIKPENIIVRSLSPADVVMVDFGIARSETDASNVTEVGETFDNKFISLPERRGPEENKRDPRSDLTGLCAILLYCLTTCVPRDLRDSSGRPPHRWNNYTLEKVVRNEVQLALLNAFFDRGFSWELDARFQTLDELISRLNEVLRPSASLPDEDLAVVAARESALLRRSDRVSQLADFRQPVQQLRQKWIANLQAVGRKLSTSRFYVHESNYQVPLPEGKFGDNLESFFVMAGVHNHPVIRVIGYHFCSTGEECAIVRKIDCGVQQQHGGYTFDPLEEPSTIARYAGDSAPPLELVMKDAESTFARLMSNLRGEIERKSAGKS